MLQAMRSNSTEPEWTGLPSLSSIKAARARSSTDWPFQAGSDHRGLSSAFLIKAGGMPDANAGPKLRSINGFHSARVGPSTASGSGLTRAIVKMLMQLSSTLPEAAEGWPASAW